MGDDATSGEAAVVTKYNDLVVAEDGKLAEGTATTAAFVEKAAWDTYAGHKTLNDK